MLYNEKGILKTAWAQGIRGMSLGGNNRYLIKEEESSFFVYWLDEYVRGPFGRRRSEWKRLKDLKGKEISFGTLYEAEYFLGIETNTEEKDMAKKIKVASSIPGMKTRNEPKHPVKVLRYSHRITAKPLDVWIQQMTQEELGKIMGVTQGFVSKVEHDILSLDAKHLAALLDYGISEEKVLEIVRYYSSSPCPAQEAEAS